MTWLAWVILIIGGYLLGSIPSAYIVVKLKKGTDIRQIGSGNIGATNTIRAAGRGTGVLVFLMDMAKGAIPTLVGMAISRDLAIVAGFAAFIGHLFPIWLNFKGGKGVSSRLWGSVSDVPLYAAVLYQPMVYCYASYWICLLRLLLRNSVDALYLHLYSSAINMYYHLYYHRLPCLLASP